MGVGRSNRARSGETNLPAVSDDGKPVDTITPVILATTAETLRNIQSCDMPLAQLQTVVARTAAAFGADSGLTASLARHLPDFCRSVLDIINSEGLVSKGNGRQYQVWTEGEHRIVRSIAAYEQNRDKYLFWIDRDKRLNMSNGCDCRAGDTAIALLDCLIERLGTRIPVSEVLECVWGEDLNGNELTEDRKCRIEAQIKALHELSGRRFRKYIYPNRYTRGLGLKRSFADKYFIFSRIS